MTAKQVEHRALCLRIAQQQHVFLAVCGRRERIDARLSIDKADARHNIAAYGIEGDGGGQLLGDDARGNGIVQIHLRNLPQQRKNLGDELFSLGKREAAALDAVAAEERDQRVLLRCRKSDHMTVHPDKLSLARELDAVGGQTRFQFQLLARRTQREHRRDADRLNAAHG